MADIQVSRFENLLRRLLSIKRSGLLTDVNPTFALSVDPSSTGMSPEYFLLQGWRLYAMCSGGNPGAGNIAAASIFNPAGSGVIAIVTLCSIRAAAAAPLEFRMVTADTAMAFPSLGTRDGRLIGNATAQAFTACSVRQGSILAAPPVGTVLSGVASPLTSVTDQLADGVVLVPGTGLVASVLTVATAGSFVLHWQERVLENSEKNA